MTVAATLEPSSAADTPTRTRCWARTPRTGGVVVRALPPGGGRAVARVRRTRAASVSPATPGGLFEGIVEGAELPLRYELEVAYPDGDAFTLRDPYSFAPTLGELDLHLAGEGRHEELYERLGAHVREIDGAPGTAFAVWAPRRAAVSVVGDFNSWDGRLHPMRSLGSSGIWELFVPGVAPGARYKFEIRTPDGELRLKADPFAFAAEHPPRPTRSSTTPRTRVARRRVAGRARERDPLDAPCRSTRSISARALEGFEAPAKAWETEILPARLKGYQASWLDAQCLAGRTSWARLTPPSAANGNGRTRHVSPVGSTPIALIERRRAPLWMALAPLSGATPMSGRAQAVLDALSARGALFFDELAEADAPPASAARGSARRTRGARARGLRQLQRPARSARALGAAQAARRHEAARARA